jgi:asparaginyl-tRNA synthetase
LNSNPFATKSRSSAESRALDVVESPWYRAIAAIQDAVTVGTVEFFSGLGLRTLHLPITTGAISSPMGLGSDSVPVQVNLLGTDTYLADSMQFMLEYACRLHPAGSYYVMPSFRGEPADATHLNQFFHSEAELSGTLEDVQALVEAYLKYLTRTIVERHGDAIGGLVDSLDHVDRLLESDAPLPRITMKEAVERLERDPLAVEYAEPGFHRITKTGERRLIEEFGGFVWVTDPEHLSVPFYQAFNNGTTATARAADLLFGLGEVVGAGQRHESAEDLRLALDLHRVDPAPYGWYVEMRERFPALTSGFGLGTERYVCWLLDHDDVRDCQIVPQLLGAQPLP